MKNRAFSLVELLIVIAIAALLLSMWAPEMTKFMARSRSVVCMNRLQQIGIAVNNYVGDNNGVFPEVETDPDNPVYEDVEGKDIKDMLGTFEPYGLTKESAYCLVGGKYEWKPIIDDEPSADPKIYRRTPRSVSLRRMRIVFDTYAVHFGKQNALYADGHVKAYLKP